jgi:hypothetical protein
MELLELLELVEGFSSAGWPTATENGNVEPSFTNRSNLPDAGPSRPAAGGLPNARPYNDGCGAHLLHEDGEHVRKLCHADVALLLQACDLSTGNCVFEIAEPRARHSRRPDF